jgi:TrmH family RNA methyltransferase
MLSLQKQKYIRSLEHKKFRILHNAFVAEGEKTVSAMLSRFECRLLAADPQWIDEAGPISAGEIIPASTAELSRASRQASPPGVIAVFDLPAWSLSEVDPTLNLILALDGVQDPGNAGAIVRVADWFGIEHIVCSPDTADIFAPKALQATMGSLAGVSVHYAPLVPWINSLPPSTAVYGTFAGAPSVYSQSLSASGLIVMGNEGNGIRPETGSLIKHRISIPPYSAHRQPAAESLNVAVAAAAACAEFRRVRLSDLY